MLRANITIKMVEQVLHRANYVHKDNTRIRQDRVVVKIVDLTKEQVVHLMKARKLHFGVLVGPG